MTRTDQATAPRRSRPAVAAPCLALAAVARRRAEEHTELGQAASDDGEIARHGEQRDHLLALADRYERMASGHPPTIEEAPGPEGARALTIEGDPFR